MHDYIEVHLTVSTQEEVDGICAAVIDARLAACVQVSGPIRSTYWWKGKVEQAKEFFLLMKTTSDHFEELARVIRDKHSYEVPEIVAVPLTHGIADYLRWISVETQSPDVQP